jgi:outer membrane autotransporter protein
MDLYREENDEGVRDHAGAYFAMGTMEADVTHHGGIDAGTSKIDGVSLGAYWTRFWEEGQYIDAVIQGTWYDAHADGGYGLGLDGEGFGVALSAEGGWPIHFDDDWIVEPQGQLVYQTIGHEDSGDAAAVVRFRDVESLAGRLGLRIAKTWTLDEDPQPRLLTVWVRPNLWHEFLDAPTTEFSSADGYVGFQPDAINWWAQINVGMTLQMTRTSSLYANAGYDFDFNGRYRGYDGKVGLRVNW